MNVGRPREGNFQQKVLYLDPKETDFFTSKLPKNLSLSEVIRQFIHDENERIRKEKKVKPPAKGALINYVETGIYRFVKDNKQTTLDIFAPHYDIVTYLDGLKETKDEGAIRTLARNGKLIHDICKTYFKRLHN